MKYTVWIRRLFFAVAAASMAVTGPAFAGVIGTSSTEVGAVQVEAVEPVEIRVVVVVATPSEFRAWDEVMPESLPFPLGMQSLGYDPDSGVLVTAVGVGTNNAAVSTLALGLDPRFDLSKAYWLIAAIAGVNPNEASIGSAAWIGDIVDSDFAKIIDVREVPADWTTGYLPSARNEPYEAPRPERTERVLYRLNKGLRDWAYELTHDIVLPDTEALQSLRAHYVGFPNGQKPPFVLVGNQISGQGYWHGAILNQHYERWSAYWTDDDGRFVMTAMEDTGVVNAIQRLEKVGLADSARVMALRTGSNYSMQAPGMDAVESLTRPYGGAGQAAFLAAYVVGARVVDEISGSWDDYRLVVPGHKPED